MIDYQGEKFKEFLSKQKISVIKAAEILGVARNTVYQYFRSDNLTREVVTNIITKFNTTEEVVFGRKGQAVVRPIHQNARDLGDFTIYDEDGLNKFVEISPGRYRMGVELVPVYAQAGYLSGYMDQEYLEELPKHYITVDKFVKGNYKAFEISGDSMDNGSIKDALPHGTIVTCREVKRDLWTSKFHTHEWPNWIIIHKTEGIVAKQISKQCLETGTLTLRSLNPDKDRYPDFEVKLDDCVQIFNVVKRELR
jgi:transcriptional regulator with XRE-family HTH domain